MTTQIEVEEGGQIDYVYTLLAMAENSVGTNLFQNLYIVRNDHLEDVTRDGELSCAFSTTAIYHVLGLLASTHSEVKGFEAEVTNDPDNWLQTDEPLPGAVGILEGKRHLDGTVKNRHTFICIGNGMAVHNGIEDGVWAPRYCAIADFKHHTGEMREVERYFVHRMMLR